MDSSIALFYSHYNVRLFFPPISVFYLSRRDARPARPLIINKLTSQKNDARPVRHFITKQLTGPTARGSLNRCRCHPVDYLAGVFDSIP